ncbi:MAG: hypothetical protein ABI575_01535 [Oxalobacteraceae bacterium]
MTQDIRMSIGNDVMGFFGFEYVWLVPILKLEPCEEYFVGPDFRRHAG